MSVVGWNEGERKKREKFPPSWTVNECKNRE